MSSKQQLRRTKYEMPFHASEATHGWKLHEFAAVISFLEFAAGFMPAGFFAVKAVTLFADVADDQAKAILDALEKIGVVVARRKVAMYQLSKEFREPGEGSLNPFGRTIPAAGPIPNADRVLRLLGHPEASATVPPIPGVTEAQTNGATPATPAHEKGREATTSTPGAATMGGTKRGGELPS